MNTLAIYLNNDNAPAGPTTKYFTCTTIGLPRRYTYTHNVPRFKMNDFNNVTLQAVLSGPDAATKKLYNTAAECRIDARLITDRFLQIVAVGLGT